jgi:6-pyruvoyl-tetrahydropterin synthase related domain
MSSRLQTPGDASPSKRPWLLVAFVLACIAITIAPLAIRGTSCGQDFDFHFESWMSVVRQWHQGVLYPHWIGSANYGAGEPRFVFYPPLCWTLGAILGILLHWTRISFAFTLICLLAMAATCYRMAREWLPPATSALAAGLYITNPYILFVIYERSALAEFLAAAWFPLLFLYALRKKPSTAQLALVIALLWLTDPPAAVMGSYALAFIVAVAAVSERSFALVVRAAAAMALGLGLTAFYLIPAVYEQRWVEIYRALATSMRIQDSFLFEHTGMAYHDQVLRSASWIAVVILIATFTAIASLIALRSKRLHPLWHHGRPLLILAAFIALLLFPISQPIWYALPKLRFLQFPWRWLLVLGLIAAVFIAEALVTFATRVFPAPHGSPSTHRIRLRRLTTAAIALILASITATHAYRHYWQICDDQDNVRAQRAARTTPGFEGTDEYTPTPADNSTIQIGLPPIRVVASATADTAADEPSDDSASGDSSDSDDDNAGNPDWQPAPHVLLPAAINIRLWHEEHIVASISSSQPAFAIFRLMSYPAWRIQINHTPAHSLPQRDDGLISVPIPAGTSTINIRYRTTPDMWAGRIVSLIALVVWFALAAKTWLRRGIMEQNASRTPAP